MIKTVVKNGNIDGAMKNLKRKLSNCQVPSKVKSKQAYEKPCVKRKREKKENTINYRRRNRGNY